MDYFGQIIDEIKGQLLNGNSQSRAQTVSNLLKILKKDRAEHFIMHLVCNGIVNDLIEKVDRKNRRDLLKCIEIMIKSNAFYTHGLVDSTITGITKYRLIDSMEEAAIAMNIILTIITKVSSDFSEFQVTLLINKHEEGLLSLIERTVLDSFSMLPAVKVLNFLIKFSTKDFKYNFFPNIKSIYISTMKFMMRLDGICNSEKIQIICRTSTLLINLCDKIDENHLDKKLSNSTDGSSVNQIPEIKKDLLESISKIAIKYLIPLAKELKIEFVTVESLIDFLQISIKLRTVVAKVLSIQLLSEGYLKYLLQLSLLYSERLSFRPKVCQLISEIILNLREYLELPINNWPGGLAAFYNFLSTGLNTLPDNLSDWEDCLKLDDQTSNALLVLVFCHFLGTEEKYIITQESLAIKLSNIGKETFGLVFLRALWLLYSVVGASAKNSTYNYLLYSKAVKNLITTLKKQKTIELVYTHKIDILLYSIRELYFPMWLRIKVISLWLENSSTNEEFDTFIQECLVQCYDELKIVKLLMIVIHKNMKNPRKALSAYDSLLRFKKIVPEEVVKFVWKTLAKDLTRYRPNNRNIIQTVLKIIVTLPVTELIAASIIRKCAKGICKVLIRKDTDIILKTLIIAAAAFAIRQSVKLRDAEVAKIFFRDNLFLKEVHDSGFSLQQVKLVEVSFRTLTCLIACQIQYNLQCKTVSRLTFEDLAILLMNLKEPGNPGIFGIKFVQLLMKNKVESPIIGLQRLETNRDWQHIYNVYFLLHAIHAGILPGKENQTYQCLTTILNYCFEQKLNLGVFLKCSSTPILIELAITGFPKSKEISSDFLHFATTWLCYLRAYHSQNKIQIEGFPKKSSELLIQFLPIALSLKKDVNNVVHDFVTAVYEHVRYLEK